MKHKSYAAQNLPLVFATTTTKKLKTARKRTQTFQAILLLLSLWSQSSTKLLRIQINTFLLPIQFFFKSLPYCIH